VRNVVAGVVAHRLGHVPVLGRNGLQRLEDAICDKFREKVADLDDAPARVEHALERVLGHAAHHLAGVVDPRFELFRHRPTAALSGSAGRLAGLGHAPNLSRHVATRRAPPQGSPDGRHQAKSARAQCPAPGANGPLFTS